MNSTMMRRIILTGFMLICAWVGAAAASVLVRGPEVQLDGRLNCPWMSERGGTAFLQLWVQAREIAPSCRRPVNCAVVIDRSGSMGMEGKIENARSAVCALIDELRPDDVLSIVIYDDVVEVLRPAGRVGDKTLLRRLVDEIVPRGWTNLGGGMVEGFRQSERYLREGYVNRVVLVSDGLANRGITDPGELDRIARRYRQQGISLSAIGVGLEYNENLMVALANGGGGNYYYLEHSGNLASIFRREFNLISTLVAQSATLDLQLGKGVSFRDAIGCETIRNGDRMSIALGDLSSGECRQVTVELDISPGRGSRFLASGQVHYATEGERCRESNTVRVTVTYTHDPLAIDRHRDWDVQARADVAISTRKVDQALRALDKGQKDGAINALKEAQAAVASSPAAMQSGAVGKMLKEQELKLRVYQETLDSTGSDVVRAKKSIQYENYRVQRNR
jgi:Ca-activated chloride channel family protein